MMADKAIIPDGVNDVNLYLWACHGQDTVPHPDSRYHWHWGDLWWAVFSLLQDERMQGHLLPHDMLRYHRALVYLSKQEARVDGWAKSPLFHEELGSRLPGWGVLASILTLLAERGIPVIARLQSAAHSWLGLPSTPAPGASSAQWFVEPRWMFGAVIMIGSLSLLSLMWHSRVRSWWLAGPPWWDARKRAKRLLRHF